jgi:hypothetical protein
MGMRQSGIDLDAILEFADPPHIQNTVIAQPELLHHPVESLSGWIHTLIADAQWLLLCSCFPLDAWIAHTRPNLLPDTPPLS